MDRRSRRSKRAMLTTLVPERIFPGFFCVSKISIPPQLEKFSTCGDFGQLRDERLEMQHPVPQTEVTSPVLSANDGVGAPIRSSIVTNRLESGVLPSKRRYCPCWKPIDLPPARMSG